MPISWNPMNWVGDLIDQRMNVAGQAWVNLARVYAPEDTGELKSKISYHFDRSTKTLTLRADAPWSLFQELGTYRMKPHPFMRPAINAVAPSFLTGKITGVTTQMMVGTSMRQDQLPRMIQPHIRPHIAAANMTHNIGAVARSKFTAIHMHRNGEPMRQNVGLQQKSRVVMSDLSKARLNKRRDAWN